MKTIQPLILLSIILFSTTAQAQTVSEIMQQYRNAIAGIESIHCQVVQLDTFLSGDVWHYNGELTMVRNRKNQLFGFYFKASKEVGEEALYDGLSDFQIDHEKQTYELTANPQTYMLGSPGGQLVVPELLNDQDPDLEPALTETEAHFVLRYTYPDLEEYDVRQREKRILLDKETFLPVRITRRQESLGKKQVITRILSAMQINQAEHQQAFQKDFLRTYERITEDEEADLHADLLHTQVKDFQLPTFNGASVATTPRAGKVLLLDFWEIWCGPCIEAMPKVQHLADTYGPQGLDVVGVLMDPNSQDSAEKLIAKQGVVFTQALGNPELRAYFRVFAIPQYVLIDQEGNIQEIYCGYSDKLEKRIKKLLAGDK